MLVSSCCWRCGSDCCWCYVFVVVLFIAVALIVVDVVAAMVFVTAIVLFLVAAVVAVGIDVVLVILVVVMLVYVFAFCCRTRRYCRHYHQQDHYYAVFAKNKCLYLFVNVNNTTYFYNCWLLWERLFLVNTSIITHTINTA